MNAPSSVSALTSALVHQSAMSPPLTRQRHATFIAKRLSISFGVLAIAPFFLAFYGAPTGAETLVFACSFAPLGAGVLAARTGRLAAAHGLAFLGLVALSLSLWLGLGCGTGCAIAWLVTAQLEATLAGERRLALGAGAVTGMILLGILAATLYGDAALTPAAAVPGAFSGLALAYAIIVGAGTWPRAEPVARHEEAGPAAADPTTWRVVSEMLDDIVVGLDKTGSVVRRQTGCETRLGVAPHDLMGRGLFDHVHVSDRPAFLKKVTDAAHGDETAPTKIRLRTSGRSLPPEYIWVEMRARRLAAIAQPADPDGEVVAVLRDIDAALARGEDIAATPGSIGAVIPSKDEFLANVSHELRTPLNAIIGFSEMLASRTLRPIEADKQRDYARIIHQSGQHLLSVVNSILDMSNIRSGTFVLTPESFDLAPLIDLCCDTVAAQGDEVRVPIVRDYRHPLAEIVGDRRAYRQILENLMANAVKFTPEHGCVTVSARLDGAFVHLSVTDTGIGIGTEDLAQIGAPFFQARSSLSRPFEGTGLGLSVVRGLVGLQGGTIALESDLGHGTRVDVRLPRDYRPGKQKRTPATIDTITRQRAPAPFIDRIDQRVKQIA